MDPSNFLDPLDALRLQARANPSLRQCEQWHIELSAAIAAARACGVRSFVLADYEALLRMTARRRRQILLTLIGPWA